MGNAMCSFAAGVQFSVFSFQCSVFSESQERAVERRNSTQLSAERRTVGTETWSLLSELLALFDGGAHRDPARLTACFENGRRWHEVVPVG